MAVRACGPGRCHDRHNRRAALVVANHDALCAGRNSRSGRGSTVILLAPDPFSTMVWSWIDECASAEHAKIFTDIAPNPKYSYRSRHGRSHRAGQNPVVGNHSDLWLGLRCGPGHEHVLPTRVGP